VQRADKMAAVVTAPWSIPAAARISGLTKMIEIIGRGHKGGNPRDHFPLTSVLFFANLSLNSPLLGRPSPADGWE